MEGPMIHRPHSARAATLAFGALLLSPALAAAELPFGPDTVADVAERVTPAVVSIATSRTSRGAPHPGMERHPLFREFFGRGGMTPRKERGAGSGVIVSADGYIVTNNHVIEGADEIKVLLADKRELSATLIGTDKPSDIALIKVDARGLPSLGFGDSAKIRLGEFVLAIGNPFGVGQTVTMGIVSAKGRANVGIVDYENFIQTDAAINPGNSGGALVDLKGKLIGINTAILSKSGGAQGIGFAVPSNMVQPILEQIREHGRVRRGWLGVAIQDLTPDLAASLDLGGITGVLISDVMPTGPAKKAGLEAGDVVVSVDRKPVSSSAELRNQIALLGPAAKARLQIVRGKRELELVVNLDEKPDGDAIADAGGPAETPTLGVSVQPLSDELRAELDAPKRIDGVVVTDVVADSPAAEAGLREGDVITSVNRKSIDAPETLARVVQGTKGKLLLRVWRRGSFLFIVVRR
jgi:serine protease Do